MLRPQRPEVITLVVAAFVTLALNVPFWLRFHRMLSPSNAEGWLFLASVAIAIVLLLNLILLLFSLKPVFRVLLSVLLPLTAVASYFMLEYGVVIDVAMVRNVIETDQREAGDLISLGLIAYVVLLGVIPAVLIWRVPWLERAFWRDAYLKLKSAAWTLPFLVLVVFPFWGQYLSFFREAKELRLSLTPPNYITAFTAYVRKQKLTAPVVAEPFGEDAHRRTRMAAQTSTRLFVVAVGETARADHFSLNGYARETNPELAKIDGLVNFADATSCGTDTAQSVPCMFSGFGRAQFTVDKAAGRENLLDILRRAGIDVVWRENQAGCKGVCKRIATEVLTGLKHPTFYASSQNYDEILIEGLAERASSLKRDTVIVLHMMGSHGPAYWKRYPPGFERFTPVCKESQFSRCETNEIVNAYDNTILYTDHVLARLIRILEDAARNGVETGMLYVSDHGESLGENNLYLHGMPYAIAPREQVHVPMLTWLSAGLRSSNDIAHGCLEGRRNAPVSHDNLFHSVLGLMDVETKAYDRGLDIFATCHKSASR